MKLVIQNTGEIDLQALFLLGASTKDGDSSKIGFFGSGNKYAIATLLRKGVPFFIYSGTRLIEITTKRAIFGGQVFQQIVIDGKETSFTTRMGPSWELWYAIREFYCNAVDEGECVWGFVEEVTPSPGVTKIYIEATPEILAFWNNRMAYIKDGTEEPLWTGEDIKVYEPVPGTSHPHAVVFRKGIKVWESSTECAFWYDCETLTINESRVAEYEFQVLTAIACAMAGAPTKEYVERCISAMHRYISVEASAYWKYLPDDVHFSDAWSEAIGTTTVIKKGSTDYLPPEDVSGGIVMPDPLVAKLEKQFPELNYRHRISKDFKETPITEKQQEWLDRGLAELKKYFYFKEGVRICMGEFKSDQTMGLYCGESKSIFISIKHMALGYDEFVSTLMEEFMHADGYGDGERRFEHHLMMELIYAQRKAHDVEAIFADRNIQHTIHHVAPVCPKPSNIHSPLLLSDFTFDIMGSGI